MVVIYWFGCRSECLQYVETRDGGAHPVSCREDRGETALPLAQEWLCTAEV